MAVRSLLRLTGLLEGGTALALLLLPAIVFELLFGQTLSSVPALLGGRLAGAALVSLAVASWCAADGGVSITGGLVRAMLLYNSLMLALLLYARMGLGLLGIALWPAVIVHILMGGWCVLGIKPQPCRSLPDEKHRCVDTAN